ncbi:MAG: hypothetical protein ACKVOI_15160 [Dongiaceae bacterium]
MRSPTPVKDAVDKWRREQHRFRFGVIKFPAQERATRETDFYRADLCNRIACFEAYASRANWTAPNAPHTVVLNDAPNEFLPPEIFNWFILTLSELAAGTLPEGFERLRARSGAPTNAWIISRCKKVAVAYVREMTFSEIGRVIDSKPKETVMTAFKIDRRTVGRWLNGHREILGVENVFPGTGSSNERIAIVTRAMNSCAQSYWKLSRSKS